MSRPASTLLSPSRPNVRGQSQSKAPNNPSQFLKGTPSAVNTDERRQKLENARQAENLKKIQGMLTTGIPFLKHNRKGKIKKRILRSVDIDAQRILWMPAKGEPDRSVLASSDEPRRVRDILMVQAANEPDPAMPDYGGTMTLRKSAGKKAIPKSFSLHFLDRTLDLEFETVTLFKEVYDGIKLLVTHHKMEAAQEEYALYHAEQNHKNKMAWVPTTDAQARIYFYNLYTRDTSWVPPPGAPRIELEWWEKTYAQRKAKKQIMEVAGEDDAPTKRSADNVESFNKSALI